VDQPSLMTDLVGRHRGLFVCRPGHPILETPHPTMREIFGYPHAHFRITVAVAARYFEEEGMAGEVDPVSGDFVPSLCFDSFRMIRAVVRASDATTWLPYPLLRDELAAGTFAVIPFEEDWMSLNYGFIWKRNRTLSLAAKAFMTAVREVEAEISSDETAGALTPGRPRRGRRPPQGRQ
jgi:DNA-binding transcriptional LysR family regulator